MTVQKPEDVYMLETRGQWRKVNDARPRRGAEGTGVGGGGSVCWGGWGTRNREVDPAQEGGIACGRTWQGREMAGEPGRFWVGEEGRPTCSRILRLLGDVGGIYPGGALVGCEAFGADSATLQASHTVGVTLDQALGSCPSSGDSSAQSPGAGLLFPELGFLTLLCDSNQSRTMTKFVVMVLLLSPCPHVVKYNLRTIIYYRDESAPFLRWNGLCFRKR